MTSKKLGALLRSVPPATAPVTRDEPGGEAPSLLATPPNAIEPLAMTAVASRRIPKPTWAEEPEVPLQVLIPLHIRRHLAMMAAEKGESLRALMLQAIRGLGIPVTDADIKGKRGRRNSKTADHE
jgi:hypothetical protein